MSCAGCEERIGNVLRRVQGVRDVDADHTSGRVQVHVGPGLTDTAALASRITAAGFEVAEEVEA
ncbi:heavy-metal-associated domain-containing protein [Pseudonocardia nigra]|uniref:heavy-metal-associated domain-containing protein n=1 Tax=Pseudonocardia nigra TaxID=1921578 RepID=UPI001FE3F652|nr:heavy metal-associated domain-containing protein [Pseudonocardia nigra]